MKRLEVETEAAAAAEPFSDDDSVATVDHGRGGAGAAAPPAPAAGGGGEDEDLCAVPLDAASSQLIPSLCAAAAEGVSLMRATALAALGLRGGAAEACGSARIAAR